MQKLNRGSVSAIYESAKAGARKLYATKDQLYKTAKSGAKKLAAKTGLPRLSEKKMRVVILRRGMMVALALLLSVGGIYALFGNPAVVGASANKRELPIYSVLREDKSISISFDAAWGDE